MAGQGGGALGLLRLRSHDDGWVIQAASVAAWTIGRRGRQVVGYYRQRGGRVSWQQLPGRLRYASRTLTGSVEELHAAVDALDADTVPESYYQRSSPAVPGPGRSGLNGWRPGAITPDQQLDGVILHPPPAVSRSISGSSQRSASDGARRLDCRLLPSGEEAHGLRRCGLQRSRQLLLG